MDIVIAATSNPGKVREFRQILSGQETILTMKEAGLDLDIVEDGTTFAENAAIKVRAVYRALISRAPQVRLDFSMILSDDSGLEIDYFDKKPGIYSARWLGADTPYTIKNQKILDDMRDVPDEKRTARYVCSIAALLRDGRLFTVTETCEGRIARKPSGQGGFGYDPIFEIPGLGTFAEVTPDEKNAVSHRGKALRAMKKLLHEQGLLEI